MTAQMAELVELLIATFTRLAPERQQLAADCSGDRDSMKLNKPSLVARLSDQGRFCVFSWLETDCNRR